MTWKIFVDESSTWLTVGGQALLLLFLIGLVFKRERTVRFFEGKGLSIAFVVALVSTLGSLFYSEVMGYEPCLLCWYQRILMYPQVLLLGLALTRKDEGALDYSLILSVPGAGLALYHYLLQMGFLGNVSAVCGAVGCAQYFTADLGYLTIPMMSLTAFLILIAVSLQTKKPA